MSNKESALKFLKLVAGGDVQAGYDKFVAADFKHHNQYFPGDRQSLLDAMAEADEKAPNESFEPKIVMEDGDKVMCFSRVLKSNGIDIAVCHIMQFKNDKIVELWDVGQVLDKNSPNKNGAF